MWQNQTGLVKVQTTSSTRALIGSRTDTAKASNLRNNLLGRDHKQQLTSKLLITHGFA
jgi:hypothetical protein